MNSFCSQQNIYLGEGEENFNFENFNLQFQHCSLISIGWGRSGRCHEIFKISAFTAPSTLRVGKKWKQPVLNGIDFNYMFRVIWSFVNCKCKAEMGKRTKISMPTITTVKLAIENFMSFSKSFVETKRKLFIIKREKIEVLVISVAQCCLVSIDNVDVNLWIIHWEKLFHYEKLMKEKSSLFSCEKSCSFFYFKICVFLHSTWKRIFLKLFLPSTSSETT